MPAGRTEIVCRYVPPGFRAGALVSALSAAILAGAAMVHIRGPGGERPSASMIRRTSPRRILAAYAVLALGTAFFPILSGKLPVPTDCGRRLLPGDITPRDGNDELWDVPTQYVPWAHAVADAYRHGRLPFRFAANGCGNPLWANPQAQVLTPTTLLSLILPVPWALAASAAIRLWLAASGAFLFFRRRGISDSSSAAAGLAYGFSLAFTTWLHYPLTYPQAIFPWLAISLERLAAGETGGLFAAAAALTALLLGGYPEGEVFAALGALAIFAAAVWRRRRKASLRPRIARLAAAALLALGLTSVVWIPQLHAILGSERSVRVQRASAPIPRPSVSELVRPPIYWNVLRYWIVPEAKGNPRDGDKFGLYSFAGRASGYAGVLIVAYALAAFMWRRAPAAVRLARIGLVVATLYVLWFPPLRWRSTPFPASGSWRRV